MSNVISAGYAPFGFRPANYSGRDVFLGPSSISVRVQATTVENVDRGYEEIRYGPDKGFFNFGVGVLYNTERRGEALTDYQREMKDILNYNAILGFEPGEDGDIIVSASNGVETDPILHSSLIGETDTRSLGYWLKLYGTEPDTQKFGSRVIAHHTARVAGIAHFQEAPSHEYMQVRLGSLGIVYRPKYSSYDRVKIFSFDSLAFGKNKLFSVGTYRRFAERRRKDLRLLPPEYDNNPGVIAIDPGYFMTGKDLTNISARGINDIIKHNSNLDITAGVATWKFKSNRTPEKAIWNAKD